MKRTALTVAIVWFFWGVVLFAASEESLPPNVPAKEVKGSAAGEITKQNKANRDRELRQGADKITPARSPGFSTWKAINEAQIKSLLSNVYGDFLIYKNHKKDFKSGFYDVEVVMRDAPDEALPAMF